MSITQTDHPDKTESYGVMNPRSGAEVDKYGFYVCPIRKPVYCNAIQMFSGDGIPAARSDADASIAAVILGARGVEDRRSGWYALVRI